MRRKRYGFRWAILCSLCLHIKLLPSAVTSPLEWFKNFSSGCSHQVSVKFILSSTSATFKSGPVIFELMSKLCDTFEMSTLTAKCLMPSHCSDNFRSHSSMVCLEVPSTLRTSTSWWTTSCYCADKTSRLIIPQDFIFRDFKIFYNLRDRDFLR